MWALRRQIVIIIGLFFIISVPVFYLTYKGFFKAPTCSDGLKNGTEIGVDCGGSCALVCKETTKPVELLWIKYFKNDNGSYDIALMIHNPNAKTSPEYLAVKLSLLSVSNSLLYESSATTSVPIGSDIPLIIQNTYLRDIPAKFSYSLDEGRSFSTAQDRDGDVTTKVFFDESSALSAKVVIINNTTAPLVRMPVRVVAYGPDMKPIAVAETKVSRVEPAEEKEIFVTFGKSLSPPPFSLKAYIPLSPYDKRK